MKSILTLVAAAALLPAAIGAIADDKAEFPLREKYPQLPTITTEALLALDDAVIVDVRNSVEYDVIHADGALNELVGDMEKDFLDDIRAEHPDSPIVFYCNGVTCSKSYKAGEKARVWGFDNYFVYDSGIFAWAQASAERTRFFGEVYEREALDEKLISKDALKAKSIAPAEFIELMRSGDYRIYDVRDKKERQEQPIKVGKMAKVSLDEFVTFLEKGAVPSENVLIFDNVGKQVRWLQYYLEREGIEGYTFLDGGVGRWVEDGYDASGNLAKAD